MKGRSRKVNKKENETYTEGGWTGFMQCEAGAQVTQKPTGRRDLLIADHLILSKTPYEVFSLVVCAGICFESVLKD